MGLHRMLNMELYSGQQEEVGPMDVPLGPRRLETAAPELQVWSLTNCGFWDMETCSAWTPARPVCPQMP